MGIITKFHWLDGSLAYRVDHRGVLTSAWLQGGVQIKDFCAFGDCDNKSKRNAGKLNQTNTTTAEVPVMYAYC